VSGKHRTKASRRASFRRAHTPAPWVLAAAPQPTFSWRITIDLTPFVRALEALVAAVRDVVEGLARGTARRAPA
jgi:hypothetical protein